MTKETGEKRTQMPIKITAMVGKSPRVMPLHKFEEQNMTIDIASSTKTVIEKEIILIQNASCKFCTYVDISLDL